MIGGVVWVLSYLYFSMLGLVSHRIGDETRIAYFRSLMNQDVRWMESQREQVEIKSPEDGEVEKQQVTGPQELSTNLNR